MLTADPRLGLGTEASSSAVRSLARTPTAGDTGRMANTLDHLPAGKRRELEYVVEILSEEFAKEVSTRWSAHLNQQQILKIILFGSYARGDWVEDPMGRYFSDYDLLVVVEKDKLTEVSEFWEGAEKRLLDELSVGQRLRTPVNFIVHTLEDVNEQLSKGRYFFVDIVRDGVPLLELPGHPFVEPKPLAPETALAEAEGYLEEYFTAAQKFALAGTFLTQRDAPKQAVFNFHQAAEQLYNCLLLVLTLYTPKSHNLVRLRGLAEPLDPRLAGVWPTETKFQKRCFELLRAAYVKARYSRQYRVTDEELAWLQERIEVLQAVVTEICEARISALRNV